MRRGNLILLTLGIAAAIYVLYELICLIRERPRTAPAHGIVCEIREEMSGQNRARRRKYARFRYETARGMTESENMVAVTLGAYVGMKRPVRYFLENPRKVSDHSVSHVICGSITALVLVILAFLL